MKRLNTSLRAGVALVALGAGSGAAWAQTPVAVTPVTPVTTAVLTMKSLLVVATCRGTPVRPRVNTEFCPTKPGVPQACREAVCCNRGSAAAPKAANCARHHTPGDCPMVIWNG